MHQLARDRRSASRHSTATALSPAHSLTTKSRSTSDTKESRTAPSQEATSSYQAIQARTPTSMVRDTSVELLQAGSRAVANSQSDKRSTGTSPPILRERKPAATE